MEKTEAKELIRALSKIEPRRGNLCWDWTGSICRDGYGTTWQKGRTASAHRLVWELFNDPIPEGMCVCHTCDNPACVNPDHLFLATQAENMADMKLKERAPNRKINRQRARWIRKAYAARLGTQRQIGEFVGVSQTQISRICRGVQWNKQVMDDGL